MKDPRIIKLAQNLINYSVKLQPGENILIDLIDTGEDLAEALIKEAYRVGGRPFLNVQNQNLTRALIMGTDEAHMTQTAGYDVTRMKDMQAYIVIRGSANNAAFADISGEKMNVYAANYTKPVHFGVRVPNTKWCIVRYPNSSFAQSANMSTEAFEDFYFNVCTLDYEKMDEAMTPLAELMEKTDKVRITGQGTDLTFSIKGIPVKKCAGERNIPDGEVFSAPVIDSVNGVITYNTPSQYQGFIFDNVRLEFKDGKVIKATSNDTTRINGVLDTDEGARFIGEFAIGVNPFITTPMKDILFDEKIMGSIHFTPGNGNNGNKSAVHWDLVYIQTPEYGGGEIWFDDVLIRKDGRFVLQELQGLNPENLK